MRYGGGQDGLFCTSTKSGRDYLSTLNYVWSLNDINSSIDVRLMINKLFIFKKHIDSLTVLLMFDLGDSKIKDRLVDYQLWEL